jgi:hypothetical protein
MFAALADGISCLYSASSEPDEVEQKCTEYRRLFLAIWDKEAVFPTTHIVKHLAEYIRRFGGQQNLDVSAWERKSVLFTSFLLATVCCVMRVGTRSLS